MKKKLIYLFIVLMLNVIGFYFLSPETFGVCVNSCFTDPVSFGVGQPLFFGTLPITIAFLIFLFIHTDKVDKIYKMFPIYLLGSIILAWLLPVDCNTLTPICINKSISAIFLGLVFLGYGLFIVFKK